MKKDVFSNKTILITGGTGSFGQAFTFHLLQNHEPISIRIFSRDELKQYEMAQKFSKYNKVLRYLIGDIRDKDRLFRALSDVDIVIHAAALKQVPSCEYNPMEAIKTNILGTQNIIEASLDNGVKRFVLISSDKAVQPLNLYGATKLCAEKLCIQCNAYVGKKPTRFSVVRYGNVVGSRGSVIPSFESQRSSNIFTITHKDMTRFWITLPQACLFVTSSVEVMKGGEIFIPKMKSLKIIDLANAMSPTAKKRFIGKRPGEKINEILITEEESVHTAEFKHYFVIQPEHSFWRGMRQKMSMTYTSYASHTNRDWLVGNELARLLNLPSS